MLNPILWGVKSTPPPLPEPRTKNQDCHKRFVGNLVLGSRGRRAEFNPGWLNSTPHGTNNQAPRSEGVLTISHVLK